MFIGILLVIILLVNVVTLAFVAAVALLLVRMVEADKVPERPKHLMDLPTNSLPYDV